MVKETEIPLPNKINTINEVNIKVDGNLKVLFTGLQDDGVFKTYFTVLDTDLNVIIPMYLSMKKIE